MSAFFIAIPHFTPRHLLKWMMAFYMLLPIALKAQPHTTISQRNPCLSSINTFPYDESFEATTGNWFSGGQNNDWVWGTPSKAVISAAGQGTKCWITGGLTGNQYNDAELSWVQSPCFDLSALANPEISFKVFWESERRFDGAGFEYSTNGGVTWSTLGSTSSNTNCQGANWFNTASIMFLGNLPGWSGNIQSTSGSCQGGGGSGAWLTARHLLTNLKGETNVSFRFTFASGTTCNAFEGFAIDAVHIGEAPPSDANFTYTCGAGRSVIFKRNAICASSTLWDFGDTGSPDNSSTDANPTHVFSTPGLHIVKLTTTFAPSGPPSFSLQNIIILDAGTSVTTAIKCSGNSNGAVTVTASGSTNPYTYSWNTTPARTTAAINNLPAGTYTVTVNSLNSCAATASIVLTEPNRLEVNTAVSPAICTADNGEISTQISGGTTPYTYLWSNGNTSSSINNLPVANYTLKVTDANGCNFTTPSLAVQRIQETIHITLGNDTFFCPGARLAVSPGNFRQYLWQDNSTSPTFAITSTGTYTVKVTNGSGCTGVASIKVTVDCSDVYFPSAITPNGDTRNDLFGPIGNVGALRKYSLAVYDRFGEKAFYSTDPFKKWNGKYKGSDYNSGIFVWITSYTLNGKAYTKKGTITLIR